MYEQRHAGFSFWRRKMTPFFESYNANRLTSGKALPRRRTSKLKSLLASTQIGSDAPPQRTIVQDFFKQSATCTHSLTSREPIQLAPASGRQNHLRNSDNRQSG